MGRELSLFVSDSPKNDSVDMQVTARFRTTYVRNRLGTLVFYTNDILEHGAPRCQKHDGRLELLHSFRDGHRGS